MATTFIWIIIYLFVCIWCVRYMKKIDEKNQWYTVYAFVIWLLLSLFTWSHFHIF